MVSLLSFKRRVWTGYVIAFLLLIISYFLIFYSMRKLIRETNWVTHTSMVLNKLESLKAQITEAETGIRGYVIAKDKRFLEPYTHALEAIPITYGELRSATADNPQQKVRLDTLLVLINRRLGFMSTALSSFEANGKTISDSMIAAREPSKNVMDSIRLYVEKMKATENFLMEQRENKLSGFFSSTQIIALITLLIAFITLFYSLIVFNKENNAKEKAVEKVIHYSTELETNVAELKQANLELQELKSMEKFTATGRIARTIAHEVRNPLTNISLATEQLQEITQGNQDTALLLDMIGRNANRINQLVSELLNATRFAQLDFKRISINQLMEETLELAKDRIELNHVQVEATFSKEECMVMVDAEKIKFALLNIIVNAIEAMEKDGAVLQLKIKKLGSKCLIEIRDNGKGMDEDILQNLFEPYFTSKQKGNGLGLTNTQNIIFNHKGSIKVYSKPGQGAVFTILLDLS